MSAETPEKQSDEMDETTEKEYGSVVDFDAWIDSMSEDISPDISERQRQIDAMLVEGSEPAASKFPESAPVHEDLTQAPEAIPETLRPIRDDLRESAFVLARQVLGQELLLVPEQITEDVNEIVTRVVPANMDSLEEHEREKIEAELTEAAFVLALKVIEEEVHLRPELVIESVREATKKVNSNIIGTLRLNPADLAIVRPAWDDPNQDISLHGVSLVADEGIERGGCILENAQGKIDTRPSSKLEQLKNAASG